MGDRDFYQIAIAENYSAISAAKQSLIVLGSLALVSFGVIAGTGSLTPPSENPFQLLADLDPDSKWLVHIWQGLVAVCVLSSTVLLVQCAKGMSEVTTYLMIANSRDETQTPDRSRDRDGDVDDAAILKTLLKTRQDHLAALNDWISRSGVTAAVNCFSLAALVFVWGVFGGSLETQPTPIELANPQLMPSLACEHNVIDSAKKRKVGRIVLEEGKCVGKCDAVSNSNGDKTSG